MQAALHRLAQPTLLHTRLARGGIPDFTGRQAELIALDRLLSRAGGGTAVVPGPAVIQGRVGVGKSALVQQYAWLNQGRYAGIWWLRAESAETAAGDLAALGKLLLPDLAAGVDTGKAVAQVLDHIAAAADSTSGTSRHWLLIFAGADRPEVIAGLLPQAGAHIIVTTPAAQWGDSSATLELDGLAPEAAFAYLTRGAGETDAAAAAHLAGDLAALPLALVQARATCRASGQSFETYRRGLLELLGAENDATDGSGAIAATFALAMQHAEAECPDATRLMGLLAFWAPDAIPLLLVSAAVMSDADRLQAVRTLADVGLLACDARDAAPLTVAVAPPVQCLMRAKLAEIGERDAAATLALDLLADARQQLSDSISAGEAESSALLPHILAAAGHAPAAGDGATTAVDLLEAAAIQFAQRGELGLAETAMAGRLANLEARQGDDMVPAELIEETRRNLALVREMRAAAARRLPPRLPRAAPIVSPQQSGAPITTPLMPQLSAAGADSAMPQPANGAVPPPPLIGVLPSIVTEPGSRPSQPPVKQRGFLAWLLGRD